ncbi:uncharacterized protein LOC125648123 isoform X3 [Ostrea edulis]|uniref:uncharacterized protein LOC125648123 isoform X3 n=1 Tax=Ostrea edulis TaxID=37623 RepID=UPI002094911F|nr:uncharacterized protein LOC125648123 isoform X3 [Ostrea edulis]
MAIRILSTTLFALYINAETNRSGVCNTMWINNQFQIKCCVDFLLVNGACKPCIGRHGINCTSPCRFGYYGFGCRHLCNCSDRQGCDRQIGCFDVDNNYVHTHYVVAVMCAILITSVVVVVAILICKKYGGILRALITATPGREDRNSGNYGKEQYDDIRESRMQSFGKKNPELRSFNSSWFKPYPWLHYDEAKDLAFCFTCMGAAKEGKISNSKVGGSFISTSFSNWKDATSKFRKHQDSDFHKESVERKVKLPRETKDIGEVLSAAHSEEKTRNRQQLLTILRNIRFLARQGLPLRGHDNEQSNFIQLLKLHGESDPSILKWLEKKQDKFTSADIQNEMLQVMALKILRDVASNIRENGYFSIRLMRQQISLTVNKL